MLLVFGRVGGDSFRIQHFPTHSGSFQGKKRGATYAG